MGDLSVIETLHEMYISLTALLFDVTLLIVVVLQGGGKEGEGNRRFLSVVSAVTGSCALTCVNFFLRHADIGAPVIPTLALHLAAYVGNIFVTYYLSLYIGSFFSKDAVRKEVWTFNRLLLYASCAVIIVYFVMQVPHAHDPDANVFAHGFFRALVGYIIELYYMCFCLTFIRKGHELNRRAKVTIVLSFVISVISFALQAALGVKPLVNYLGVSLALMAFYFLAETPDYYKLQQALAALQEEKRTSAMALKRLRMPGEADSKAQALSDTVKEADTERTDSALKELYASSDALDYDEAIRLLSTDDLLDVTLREFTEGAGHNAEELKHLLEAEDYENFTIRVHALKSASKMIGATALSEKARWLEDLGNRVMKE